MNLHAEGLLLYTITASCPPDPRVAFRYDRGAIYRYLARFAELDDAKIFYTYGHADELAAKEAARGAYV